MVVLQREKLTVLTRIHRALVQTAPKALRLPMQMVPFALQKQVMRKALTQVFKEALAEGDFEFLQGSWLKLNVEDAGLCWFISYQDQALQIAEQIAEPDVTFTASLNDLILMAARKEDPDSLFFQRRLKIEGDTELGLEVKNLIDSLDLAVLPALLQRALGDLATFIQQGTNLQQKGGAASDLRTA